MLALTATFVWEEGAESRKEERTLNTVGFVAAWNRGGWIDLGLTVPLEGVPAGTKVTLRSGEDSLLDLAVVARFREQGGSEGIRTIPSRHLESDNALQDRDAPEVYIYNDPAAEDAFALVQTVAEALKLPFHETSTGKFAMDKLIKFQPLYSCFPVPVAQPPDMSFAELLGMVAQRTQGVLGWTRPVVTDKYVLTGTPEEPAPLRLTHWTLEPVPPGEARDPRRRPPKGLRIARKLEDDPFEFLKDHLLKLENLLKYEQGKEEGSYLKGLLSPGAVQIEKRSWFAVEARTVLDLSDTSDARVVLQLDLVDPHEITARFVPRSYTLVGELVDAGGGSVWSKEKPFVVDLKPHESDLGLASWAPASPGRTSIPALVAAPFAPRAADDVALYARWNAGDLVIFQVSSLQAPVVLGALGKRIDAFEEPDAAPVQMASSVEITGDVAIAGNLEIDGEVDVGK